MSENETAVKHSIDKIEVTEACLTGRAGLALISKYLKAIGIEKILTGMFSFLKKSSKGTHWYRHSDSSVVVLFFRYVLSPKN